MNHVIYTIEGRKILSCPPGKEKILGKGDLVFMRKGAFRQGIFPEATWKVIVFCIPDSYLQGLARDLRTQVVTGRTKPLAEDALIGLHTNDTTHDYFYGLLPYFTQAPPPPESLVGRTCRELFFHILSNPANGVLLSYVNCLTDPIKPSLVDVMEDNFMYNLSLEEFARISRRSLTVFKKDFSEIFHTTPGKWLIKKRLDYAYAFLSSSQKKVSEIAYDSGFESVTHFYRVFKEQFGQAPLRYRRQALERAIAK